MNGEKPHRAAAAEHACVHLETAIPYVAPDVEFLQLVANQVAVAVENALAFQQIEALKEKLAKEDAYLAEEVRITSPFHQHTDRTLPEILP